MEYLKLFENHSQYEDFIETEDFVRPNVSLCVQENEVHYTQYFLTPKQIVECFSYFVKSITRKFYEHRLEHMDVENYDILCEQKFYSLYHENEIAKKLLLRNHNIYDNSYAGLMYPYEQGSYVGEIFSSNINFYQELSDMRFDDPHGDYQGGRVTLYKTDELYNGNDVFYIVHFDPQYGDADEDFQNIVNNMVQYGDNIVLLSPHNTFSNFTIAYPDGNGGYTTTKPQSFTLTPTIVDSTLYTSDYWISLFLFNDQDQEISTRVDNAIVTLKSDFKNWFNNNFSALSVLDDIKIEVPKDIYNILTNPWGYFDEEEIFNVQESSNSEK